MDVFRQTKLRPPVVRDDLISRTRLLERLDAGAAAGSVLLSAPAGYGKTTLVLQWAAARPEPLAWVDLDRSDDDLVLLVRLIQASVEEATGEDLGPAEGLLQGATAPAVDVLVAALVKGFEELARDVILVLEDSHCLHGEQVWHLLGELVRRPPRHLRVVFETRRDPPLPLARLRGRGLLAEVREADLRFTPEEGRAFLTGRLGSAVEDVDVDSLLDHIEGWAAGLHLAVLSLEASGDPGAAARRFTGSDRYIMDYLLDEILHKMSANEQERLLKTAVLDSFDIDLYAFLLDDGRPSKVAYQERLGWLRGTPFVVPIAGRPGWYRYHHLFQELLQDRLRSQYGPALVSELHARAATWLSARGHSDEALRHARLSGDGDLPARIVEDFRRSATDSERWQDLRRWMGQLPEELIGRRPGLLVARAQELSRSWRLEEADQALEETERLLTSRLLSGREDEFADILGEADSLRAIHYYWQGDGTRSRERAERALGRLSPSPSRARGVALLYLAGSMQLEGDVPGAVSLLEDALKEDRPSAGTFPTPIIVGLYALHLMGGDIVRAEQAVRRLLDLSEERHLIEGRAWAELYLGWISYHRDDLAGAETHFTAVIENRLGAHFLAGKEAFYGLALLHQARGDEGRADDAVAMLVEWLFHGGDRSTRLETDAFRARLQLMRGREPSRGEWAEAAGREEAWDNLLAVSPELPPLTLAWVLTAAGEEPGLRMAEALLQHVGEVAERTQNRLRSIQKSALQALLLHRCGDRERALLALETAVAYGREGAFVRLFADLGPEIAGLLAELAVRRPGDGYVSRLAAHSGAGVQDRELTLAPPDLEVAELLTNREMDVLELLAERLSNKEIAQRLYVSPLTVKRHTINIYAKLGAGNRREAAVKARELGLLAAPEATSRLQA